MERALMALMLCQLVPAIARSAELACPEDLHVEQKLTAPDGWTSFDEAEKGRHPFENAGFSEGPPEEYAWLSPDREKKTKKGVVLIYDLRMMARGVWLNCHYSGTTVILGRALPRTTTECRVTLDPKYKVPVTLRVDCE
jgi:hypothetical protein